MTNYSDYINKTLEPKITEKEVILDLFAGCGGLSLGFEAAGYKTIGFEMDKVASNTYNNNLSGTCFTKKLVLDFEYPEADIIIGGPPCQPFSVGGLQYGVSDSRDGFPIFIDAVKKQDPKLFMFENVRGLLYSNKWYFDLILVELRKLGYIVEFRLLNAVNFGVPQNRERLFVIGHRGKYSFPTKQHIRFTVADAIGDTIDTIPKGSKFLTESMDLYVAKYEKASQCVNPRDLNYNKPARTLTCRNLAGATGDMQRIKLKDGRRRRLVNREAARLQSFPDWFEFYGNETQIFNQIGNAVPPMLSYNIALSIKTYLSNTESYSKNQIFENNLSSGVEISLF